MLTSNRNLQYLLAISEHLHFSNAAKACFVSQSTLSAGIKNLEHSLNVKLVERNNKSVLLTPIGQKVAKQAQVVIFAIQDLTKISNTSFFDCKIKIGVIPTIAPYLLTKFISTIKNKHPNLEIIINEDTSENLLPKVAQMQLDFAIFAFPFEEVENINQHRVFEDELYLVKHKKWHKGTGKGSLLLLNQGHCLRTHILDNAAIHQHQISEYLCSDLATLTLMINMQIGVGYLPKIAIENGILDNYPNLIIDKNQLELSRHIGVIYRKKHPHRDAIVALSDYLRPLHKDE
ncbi:Hydrogen peroxide-inducible genes activator [uncultured Candidatus Thioglobus sp.]|nr:Hydrogen peroxide-inducible genes activator [uncultured Candidatus Thioglobus sp.]